MSSATELPQNQIDPLASRIVESLQKGGFETYLVGGCVRDLLVGITPKDFDIATSAQPEEVKRLIPRSHIIGRRFRLVLVRRQESQFEIATFRRNSTPEDIESTDPGQKTGDNYFGTSEEDAFRRDFTINALFYDPKKQKVIDHVHGLKDIRARLVRMIGSPMKRLEEDPIRILRALRLAHLLNFQIEEELREAIVAQAPLLQNSILPRVREEFIKILKLRDPMSVFLEMKDLGILKQVLPTIDAILEDSEKTFVFEQRMHRWQEVGVDKSNLLELTSAFLVSIAGVLTAENPEWMQCSKEELGYSKLEYGNFERACSLVESLNRPDKYLRKGPPRRKRFLTQFEFDIALKIGAIEGSIPPTLLYFWNQELRDFATDSPSR